MLKAITRDSWRKLVETGVAELRGLLGKGFEALAIAFETVAATFVSMAIISWILLITLSVPVLVCLAGSAAVTLVSPGQTALALLYALVLWAIITRFAQATGALRLRPAPDNKGRLVTGGFLSVGFGVLATICPGTSVFSTMWLTGFYTVALGVLMLLRAFHLRGLLAVRIG